MDESKRPRHFANDILLNMRHFCLENVPEEMQTIALAHVKTFLERNLPNRIASADEHRAIWMLLDEPAE